MSLQHLVAIGIFCWPVYLSATDWNAAAVGDPETLLQNDIDSGQSRNPLGLLFAIGVAAQRAHRAHQRRNWFLFSGVYRDWAGEKSPEKLPPEPSEGPNARFDSPVGHTFITSAGRSMSAALPNDQGRHVEVTPRNVARFWQVFWQEIDLNTRE